MPQYVPFPAYPDDAPLDLRFAYGQEAPAGKHGFLKVEGDHFAFEDHTVARFWGTNFNSGANFPTHEYAEAVTKRLAKIGCNLVRFHQLDAEWSTPNIFQFTKGERLSKTTELCEESMERLDYLIWCMKQNGIYAYMDVFTYRKFKSGDGVENAFLLNDAARPYGCYNRRLIELQKDLAAKIWNHVNPYTGLAYKDDPVFVLCEIVNESTPTAFQLTVEPYVTEFRGLYKAWLKEKGICGIDADTCDVNAGEKTLTDFKIELFEKYNREMYDYFRQIGVKIPITGSNFSITRGEMRAQLDTDFLDDHPYFWSTDWREKEKYSVHTGISQQKKSFLDRPASNRCLDKPFFISEWDCIWPNSRRAEAPLFAAAVGLLQGWSGFAIHTYAYGTRLEHMILGKEFSCASIGGTPYREGIFSTWNDPAKFGLFYHAALMTRRGDIAKSGSKTALKMTDLWSRDYTGNEAYADSGMTGAEYEGKCCEAADHHAPFGAKLPRITDSDVTSDTGELYRNWVKEYGLIDSPRTKVAYGSLRKNGTLTLHDLTIDCRTEFAVIALSSLTDAPCCQTDNLLLTAVGRARNRGAQFEGNQMLAYGTAPVEIEVIEADIALKTQQKELCVWAVSAEGYYIGRVPAQWEDGVLRFTLGNCYPTMYYLIRSE